MAFAPITPSSGWRLIEPMGSIGRDVLSDLLFLMELYQLFALCLSQTRLSACGRTITILN